MLDTHQEPIRVSRCCLSMAWALSASARSWLASPSCTPPCALRLLPDQVDGDWRYDARRVVLVWTIELIDETNRSGSMEFVVSF